MHHHFQKGKMERPNPRQKIEKKLEKEYTPNKWH